ncbi:MAG TPA: hypothetical protein VFN09_01580 [Rhodanobacteraceae bacterium]|nr:hypothetical protein [Rhodanobacteraceae bacterium]
MLVIRTVDQAAVGLVVTTGAVARARYFLDSRPPAPKSMGVPWPTVRNVGVIAPHATECWSSSFTSSRPADKLSQQKSNHAEHDRAENFRDIHWRGNDGGGIAVYSCGGDTGCRLNWLLNRQSL